VKKCPGPLTWQAVVDGEEDGARYAAHLERCPACRAVYDEIREAADLAGRLRSGAALRPDFANAVLAKARMAPARYFPAGLVAALLFAVTGAAALLLVPGYWSWWLSVGLTRSCGLLMDAFFRIIYLGQSLDRAWLLGPALLLVLLEISVLKKLKTVEEC
jgi:predicted anti-sigma-YlaC factor YlaD